MYWYKLKFSLFGETNKTRFLSDFYVPGNPYDYFSSDNIESWGHEDDNSKVIDRGSFEKDDKENEYLEENI